VIFPGERVVGRQEVVVDLPIAHFGGRVAVVPLVSGQRVVSLFGVELVVSVLASGQSNSWSSSAGVSPSRFLYFLEKSLI